MFGLQVLVPGVDPLVDIVVLHGLDGHPQRSFTATVDGVDICWLSHPGLLPASLPQARVLTFGYDVKTKARAISMANLEDHADHLLQNLERLRLDTQSQTRPIIFLAHSLGGIVVKQALVRTAHEGVGHSIFGCTKGVLFFGTPHRGSAWASLHSKVLKLQGVFASTTSHIAKLLAKNSDYLDQLQVDFKAVGNDIEVVCFYEELAMNPSVGLKLVSRHSAVPDVEYASVKLRKNHINMVKFGSSIDEDYITTVWYLKKIVSERRGPDIEQRSLEAPTDVPAQDSGVSALRNREYGLAGK